MKIVTTLLLSLFASSVLFAQSGKTVQVQTRANSTVENWTPYEAHTVDNLKGFKKKKEPALSVFGGYKTNRSLVGSGRYPYQSSSIGLYADCQPYGEL